MSLVKVQEYFKNYDMLDRIIISDKPTGTVAEAAQALNCTEGEIAKSLSFKLKEDIIMIVTAGDAKIDNAKYKAEFHEKAHMISFDEVEPLIGHAIGGVTPFAVNPGVKVYLDETLKAYNLVYPACGSDNSAIGLSIAELEKYSNYIKWVNVCK